MNAHSIFVQECRLPKPSITELLHSTGNRLKGRSHIVGANPKSDNHLESVVKHAIDMKDQTHIFQFCSHRRFKHEAHQQDCLISWFQRWEQEGGLRLGGNTLQKLEIIETPHSTQTKTIKATIQEGNRITNTVKERTIYITLAGYDYRQQYLTSKDLIDAYSVLELSSPSEHNGPYSKGPTFFSKSGLGRSAALMVLHETLEQNRELPFSDVNEMIKSINKTIQAGREQRGKEFLFRQTQYDAIIEAATKLIFSMATIQK